MASGRVRLLGGTVDLVNCDQVMDFIADAVATDRKSIIGNQNLHSLYLSKKSAKMSAFYDRADLIEIDSMPLVFWSRLLGLRLTADHRCTYLDWRDRFWKLAAANGWRVFCLGGAEATNRKALYRLQQEWRGANLRGHHGYFDHSSDSAENAAILGTINAFRPDIILVGMGMPLQEAWIMDNYDELLSGVLLSVGAALDYEAGVQRAAPRTYGYLGIEWAYRLIHEPQRLFGRYLIEPWSLIAPAMRDIGDLMSHRRRLAPRDCQPRASAAIPSGVRVNPSASKRTLAEENGIRPAMSHSREIGRSAA
jgi:N-acetylglucosaminyldiphosphoundecaprenol N-acetyl-beta-D-mannosaminyltransferase